MTERRAILSGSTFEEQIGYARAVVDGDWVHVSGTTGFDYTAMTISDDVVEQAEQCLRNIEAALAEAKCTFADVVRVRYLLPDRADFEPCWPVLRRCFGDVRPAATMLVCGLADPRMKIEIEVYARRRVTAGRGQVSGHVAESKGISSSSGPPTPGTSWR
ncbi:RidA family protein [Streptomyces sp. WAC 06783]|uniref:RidA family protein n=1 Tax=Streptomyces sp. WAC 06783 TaxID=2203211 RepID=UPI0021AD8377|nr:RidA family protein [Streptomyces sp. WAC 06783]